MAANETRIRISKTIHLQNHSKFSLCHKHKIKNKLNTYKIVQEITHIKYCTRR